MPRKILSTQTEKVTARISGEVKKSLDTFLEEHQSVTLDQIIEMGIDAVVNGNSEDNAIRYDAWKKRHTINPFA